MDECPAFLVGNLPLRSWEKIFISPEETKPERKILDRLHDFLEEQPPAYAACVWEIRKAVDEGWARVAVAKTNRKANLYML